MGIEVFDVWDRGRRTARQDPTARQLRVHSSESLLTSVRHTDDFLDRFVEPVEEVIVGRVVGVDQQHGLVCAFGCLLEMERGRF